MLNKLWPNTYFWLSANQTSWSRLLIQIQILNGKQCRSRSVGFFRSQLIWIYTVCKGSVYRGSAGLGLAPLSIKQLGSIVQVVACLTACPGVCSKPSSQPHNFRWDWPWIISTVILPLLLIQEKKLSVSGKSLCTSAGLLLRRLSLPRKS